MVEKYIPIDFYSVKRLSKNEILEFPFDNEQLDKIIFLIGDDINNLKDDKNVAYYIKEVRRTGLVVGDLCIDEDSGINYKIVGYDSGHFRMRVFKNGIISGPTVISCGKKIKKLINEY